MSRMHPFEVRAVGPGSTGRRPVRSLRPVCLVAVALAAAVVGARAVQTIGSPPAEVPAADRAGSDVRDILMDRIGSAARGDRVVCRGDSLCGSDVLPRFYRGRDFAPAWFEGGRGPALAASLIEALRGTAADGLTPEDYHLEALAELLDEAAGADGAFEEARPEHFADLDMLLTDAFLLCGSHLLHGRIDPETIQPDWSIQGRFEDLAAVLETGLRTGDVAAALDTLRPGHGIYQDLRTALAACRAVAARGGYPSLSPGPSLRTGDRGERPAVLREILTALGDLPPADDTAPDSAGGLDEEPGVFDERLEAAVKSFQRRHGLTEDGVVGAKTRDALNQPIELRLFQVAANLERWRWITHDLGRRHVLVNIAGFDVRAVEEAGPGLSMRAVVGRDYRKTPVFSGLMTYLELNPTWTVPPTLAVADIVPRIRRDPAYLANQRIRVFSGWEGGSVELDPTGLDWENLSAREIARLRFRQDAGPRNALGRIKFMFPNKYSVYLHDTPDRHLFDKAERAASSGCIRVERPLELADWLLAGHPDWPPEALRVAIDGGRSRTIVLPEPVKVHLLYWTAWLSPEGAVQFREDVYRRDIPLIRALRERSPATAIR